MNLSQFLHALMGIEAYSIIIMNREFKDPDLQYNVNVTTCKCVHYYNVQMHDVHPWSWESTTIRPAQLNSMEPFSSPSGIFHCMSQLAHLKLSLSIWSVGEINVTSSPVNSHTHRRSDTIAQYLKL